MTLNRNGFQTFVNRDPSPAVVGQFASQNPRATVLAGAGALRAASTLDYLGVVNSPVIGRAAWAQGLFATRQKPAGASTLGIVANELQTIIPFLAAGAPVNATRLSLEAGFPTTLYTHGDFWAQPDTPVNGIVSPGDIVYARPADGTLTNDAVAFSATGVQALFVMTISAVTKGALVPGMALSGTTLGSVVVAQVTGTPGGAGTYTMSVSETVGSATVTSAAVNTGYLWQSQTVVNAVSGANASIAAGTGILTLGSVASGVVEVGQNVTGTGVPNNLFITGQKSGTPGGAGDYYVNSIGPAVAAFTATLSQATLAKISRTY